MKRMFSALFFLLVTAVAAAAAGPDTPYKMPRTKDGRPDLQGVWNFASGVPLQRPMKFADKKVLTKEEFEKQHAAMASVLGLVAKIAPVENVQLDWIDSKLYVEDLRTSLITYPDNGRLPALVEGVRRNPPLEELLASLSDLPKDGPPPAFASLLANFGAGKKDSYTDFNRAERCLENLAVPLMPQFADSYVQIIQSSDQVALIVEGDRRIITLGAGRPLSSKIRTSTGISTGRWDGDTLVVETKNFSARTPGFAGAGNSRDKVVTERFTRTAKGLEYSATVIDPSTFTDRVELSFPMAHVDVRLYEATCHEGNYALANILSGARKQDQETKP
jgi:hypothetical protein